MNQTQDEKISLRQYVLPYSNYATGKRGWQFGMPPASGHPGDEGLGEELSVRVIQENGRVFSANSFSVTRPHQTGPDQPPRPDWFWVPVRCGGAVRFASVIPPQESRGSVPLSHFKKTGRERILLKPEAKDSGQPMTKPDLPFAISTTGLDESSTENVRSDELRAGGLILADLGTGAGQIRWIRPLEAAFELGLWTSHLSRLAQLKYAHGIRP